MANDEYFSSLLEVRGGFFKRLFYRGISSTARKFYGDYVKWCSKNNRYVDFIQPLYWHLYCMGYSKLKIRLYMNNIKDEVLDYLRKTEPMIDKPKEIAENG